MEIVELSHVLEEGMPTYPTHTKFFQNVWQSKGDIAMMNQLVIGEHTGTHIDSPSHFPIDGPNRSKSIDQILGTEIMGRCVKIFAGSDLELDAMVGTLPLVEWEAINGPILEGDIVIFDFSWEKKRWALGEKGFSYLEGWPGISEESADFLRDRGVKAVGTDCMSLDSSDGGRGKLPAHFKLLTAGIYIIENLTNLEKLPNLSIFMALPLRIANGTGSPIRAIAFRN